MKACKRNCWVSFILFHAQADATVVRKTHPSLTTISVLSISLILMMTVISELLWFETKYSSLFIDGM